MTPKNKPTLDIEAFRNRERVSEFDHFLIKVNHRTNYLFEELQDGKLNTEVVALETLLSVFSTLADDGRTHSDIKSAYPLESWQEETVEVPAELLRPLVQAWVKYKDSGPQKTFGECLGTEGGGQGKKPLKAALKRVNLGKKYSNAVRLEYLVAQHDGGRISWEQAISIVAEEENVSAATVKRASEKMRSQDIEIMQARGFLKS